MNAKKSWLFFVIALVGLVGFVWAFAHGCQTVGEDLRTGVVWLVGSLIFAALGVFLSYKLKKK